MFNYSVKRTARIISSCRILDTFRISERMIQSNFHCSEIKKSSRCIYGFFLNPSFIYGQPQIWRLGLMSVKLALYSTPKREQCRQKATRRCYHAKWGNPRKRLLDNGQTKKELWPRFIWFLGAAFVVVPLLVKK